MRKFAEFSAMGLAMLAEPVCHLFGLPHPEGMAVMVINYYASKAE